MTQVFYRPDVLPVVTGQLADCQLVDWTTRGLADAVKRTKTKHAMSPVASATCPVRESSSSRVGVSASCLVTLPVI